MPPRAVPLVAREAVGRVALVDLIADSVAHLDLHAPDADAVSPIQNQLVERLTPGTRHDLGIPNPLDAVPFGEDHRGGDYRTGQASPADLVHSGDATES